MEGDKKYLIIEWLNSTPIINGANYYDEKGDALKAAIYLENLAEKSKIMTGVSVEYTICEIYKGKVPV